MSICTQSGKILSALQKWTTESFTVSIVCFGKTVDYIGNRNVKQRVPFNFQITRIFWNKVWFRVEESWNNTNSLTWTRILASTYYGNPTKLKQTGHMEVLQSNIYFVYVRTSCAHSLRRNRKRLPKLLTMLFTLIHK